MGTLPASLSPWQAKQAAMLYHCASLDYLKGLHRMVTDAMNGFIEPLLTSARNQGRDSVLIDPRWGTRNTVENWSNNAWPFLKEFQTSLVKDIALSPALDPARLAARLQIARFDAGKVTVENFDVHYLGEESARYGTEALREMRSRADEQKEKPLHDKVAEALTNKARGVIVFMPTPPADIPANLTVWPKSTKLPESFLRIPSKQWDKGDNPLCLTHVGERCDAFLLDVTGDGKNEIIIVSLRSDGRSVVLQENGAENWQPIGSFFYGITGCKWLREAIRNGSYKAVAPKRNDVEFAGRRVPINHLHFYQGDKCANG